VKKYPNRTSFGSLPLRFAQGPVAQDDSIYEMNVGDTTLAKAARAKAE